MRHSMPATADLRRRTFEELKVDTLFFDVGDGSFLISFYFATGVGAEYFEYDQRQYDGYPGDIDQAWDALAQTV